MNKLTSNADCREGAIVTSRRKPGHLCGALRDSENPGPPGRPLSVAEKQALAPYIPRIDLEAARLHERVPFYLHRRYQAIARGNHVYFRPGAYDPAVPAGIALLGHELVHVGQYRAGMSWLSYLWSARLGYFSSPYEQAAYAVQARILADLCGGVDLSRLYRV
jgi:hypothetical protein